MHESDSPFERIGGADEPGIWTLLMGGVSDYINKGDEIWGDLTSFIDYHHLEPRRYLLTYANQSALEYYYHGTHRIIPLDDQPTSSSGQDCH